MPALHIHATGDGAWPDLLEILQREPARVVHLPDPVMHIASLPGGMTSGAASVCIRIDLPDGRIVLAETSLRLLRHAVEIFEAAARPKGEG